MGLGLRVLILTLNIWIALAITKDTSTFWIESWMWLTQVGEIISGTKNACCLLPIPCLLILLSHTIPASSIRRVKMNCSVLPKKGWCHNSGSDNNWQSTVWRFGSNVLPNRDLCRNKFQNNRDGTNVNCTRESAEPEELVNYESICLPLNWIGQLLCWIIIINILEAKTQTSLSRLLLNIHSKAVLK